jgi:protein-tyrosine-phosphatase
MRPDRRLLLALPLMFAAAPAAAACRPQVVLFVCPAGTVKSAIARETLRRRAAATGLAVDVRSRGVAPEDHVSPELARRLRADGIDPAAEPVLAVTAADVARADVVVAFDAAAEAPVMKGSRAWATPSWNAEYDAAWADLDRRLDGLVAELAAGCAKAGR